MLYDSKYCSRHLKHQHSLIVSISTEFEDPDKLASSIFKTNHHERRPIVWVRVLHSQLLLSFYKTQTHVTGIGPLIVEIKDQLLRSRIIYFKHTHDKHLGACH